jgi:UDP-glucose 4-epimerase
VSFGIDWGRWLDIRLRAGSPYKDLPVAVVGASGFIGAACAEALSYVGARVTIVSRSAGAVPLAVRQLQGDAGQPDIARAAVAGQAIVFDFIGTVAAVESNRDPLRSLSDDCLPHLRLFLACAEAGNPPLVVFPSSRLVYGRPDRLPVSESQPLRPQSMYAAHKVTVEHYLGVLGRSAALPHLVFRIANPYGPYQRSSTRGHGILNHFVRTAVQGRPLSVYGDGGQLRDYVFIPDLVSMLLLAASDPLCRNETYNVGGAGPVSMRDAAATVARLAGSEVVHVPWPDEALQIETGDYMSDMAKLRAALGDLALTPFEDGIRETIAFYREELCIAGVAGRVPTQACASS